MIRSISLVLFLFVLSFSKPLEADAQIIRTRLDLVGGVAYPEFLHGGIRYQYAERTQIGLYYGGDMGFKPEIITTWSIDHMYHFGKNNFNSNRPVWYTRQGYTYSRQLTTYKIYDLSYLELSLGYEFPLNNYVGLNFDLGMNVKIRERQADKDPNGSTEIDPRWFTGVMARFQIYISI